VVLFLGTLVVRSYAKLLAVDPGFSTGHLLSAEITLPEPRYGDDSPVTNHFYEQLLAKLAQSPGVIAAATTTQTPLKASQVVTRFMVEGAAPLAPGAFPVAQFRYVSPGFFQTMGLRLREGRIFEQKDIEKPTNVMVVNEAFAKRYLSGRDAVGAHVVLSVLSAHPEKFPVIGVVSDAHDLGVETDAEPEFYVPGFGLHAVVLVRSVNDAEKLESMAPMMRNAVRELDARLGVYNMKTVDAVLSDSLALQRMTAVLLGIFAGVVLLLAGIGIYGVLSYSVAQRTREIGVRMAVGANRIDILRLVLGQVGQFALLGAVAGLGVAFAGGRLMGSLLSGLLFETSTVDPVSVAVTLGSLALIAALAATLPAGRAASVNPSESLRAE
jgi:predicted permease